MGDGEGAQLHGTPKEEKRRRGKSPLRQDGRSPSGLRTSGARSAAALDESCAAGSATVFECGFIKCALVGGSIEIR